MDEHQSEKVIGCAYCSVTIDEEGRPYHELSCLGVQIKRLKDFIISEVPEEPSRDESTIDSAIRIIRDLQKKAANPLLCLVGQGALGGIPVRFLVHRIRGVDEQGALMLEKVDDPVFVLRGQDRLTVDMIFTYARRLRSTADLRVATGTLSDDLEKVAAAQALKETINKQADEIEKLANEIAKWQQEHPDRTKWPD